MVAIIFLSTVAREVKFIHSFNWDNLNKEQEEG